VQASSVKTSGFSETSLGGIAPFSIASTSKNNSTVRTELGARIDVTNLGPGGNINLFARAAWGYYASRDANFSGSLVGLEHCAQKWVPVL
jgi:uncharacterized protein with beta-barrel porin domain